MFEIAGVEATNLHSRLSEFDVAGIGNVRNSSNGRTLGDDIKVTPVLIHAWSEPTHLVMGTEINIPELTCKVAMGGIL